MSGRSPSSALKACQPAFPLSWLGRLGLPTLAGKLCHPHGPTETGRPISRRSLQRVLIGRGPISDWPPLTVAESQCYDAYNLSGTHLLDTRSAGCPSQGWAPLQESPGSPHPQESGHSSPRPAALSPPAISPMLDVLAIRSFPGRSLLGKDNLSADLARFSLDTSLAGVDSWRHGPTAPYPSPPMSGSPLQSDLPESQPEERRQAQESRPSPGTQSAQANAPRTDVEAEQIASPPARPPLWTTPRPPASSPSFHRVLSAPVLPGLLADPGSSQGGYTTRHIPSTHRPPFQPRLSPRSPRVPRTTKAHVHSACSNCRAAHLACDGKPEVHRWCVRLSRRIGDASTRGSRHASVFHARMTTRFHLPSSSQVLTRMNLVLPCTAPSCLDLRFHAVDS